MEATVQGGSRENAGRLPGALESLATKGNQGDVLMRGATPTENPRSAGPAGLEIVEVRGRRQRNEFLKLPWSIYAGDPQWVPPLLVERREFINPRKHPFYLHGDAALFIARLDGKPVGRILASDDPRYNEAQGTNVGCFGMFESIDDPRVAHALLDAAAGWLRARGRTDIMGPIDYSTNYACGLLIEGFDTPPRVFMNHNPPYYRGLLESWGLAKAKDLYGWWFVIDEFLYKRFGKFADRVSRRGNVKVRPFRMNDKKAEIMRCKQVYNQAWENNWGFVKMTDPEFMHFAKSMMDVVPPQMLLIAEIEGEVVGFSLMLPDLNEAWGPLDGRLFRWGLPIGLIRFFRNLKRIRTGRLIALGVRQEYRRRGISELLILRTLEQTIHDKLLSHAELGWTLEDNDRINHTIESTGATRYKLFRIYEKSLVARAPGTGAV